MDVQQGALGPTNRCRWNWEKTDGPVFAIESSEAEWEVGGESLPWHYQDANLIEIGAGDEI